MAEERKERVLLLRHKIASRWPQLRALRWESFPMLLLSPLEGWDWWVRSLQRLAAR